MEKNDARNSYINMIIGSIGMLLFVFAALKHMSLTGNAMGFALVFLGFIIMVHYIYFLEKKIGISDKLIWIRAIILMIATIVFGYVFY